MFKTAKRALVVLAFLGSVAAAAHASNVVYTVSSWLSITGTSLTSSYQTGTKIGLQGTSEIDAPVAATFAAATSLTGLDFQIVVSDDGTTWTPVYTFSNLDGTTALTHTLAASAGNTVRDRLQTTNHRNAKYTTIQVKTSSGSGASKAGDAASSSVNYRF